MGGGAKKEGETQRHRVGRGRAGGLRDARASGMRCGRVDEIFARHARECFPEFLRILYTVVVLYTCDTHARRRKMFAFFVREYFVRHTSAACFFCACSSLRLLVACGSLNARVLFCVPTGKAEPRFPPHVCVECARACVLFYMHVFMLGAAIQTYCCTTVVVVRFQHSSEGTERDKKNTPASTKKLWSMDNGYTLVYVFPIPVSTLYTIPIAYLV